MKRTFGMSLFHGTQMRFDTLRTRRLTLQITDGSTRKRLGDAATHPPSRKGFAGMIELLDPRRDQAVILATHSSDERVDGSIDARTFFRQQQRSIRREGGPQRAQHAIRLGALLA